MEQVDWNDAIVTKRQEQIAKGHTPESDRKKGAYLLLQWANDYARRGRHMDAAGLVQAAMEVIHWEAEAPQRAEQAARRIQRGVPEGTVARYRSDIWQIEPLAGQVRIVGSYDQYGGAEMLDQKTGKVMDHRSKDSMLPTEFWKDFEAVEDTDA